MANNVVKVNGIAIANIAKLNGITDANLVKLNGEEFTGTPPDAHTLIASATASASATLEFTSGIDSTYNEYQFHFLNMHPASSGVGFQFQVNATDGADYNDSPIHTTHVQAYHNEAGSDSGLAYSTGNDADQSTSYIPLLAGLANDADSNASGVLNLYAPSSTTYVKHFISNIQFNNGTYSTQAFTAGYIEDATAIDNISFKFSSGNIDAGIIKMYGVIK